MRRRVFAPLILICIILARPHALHAQAEVIKGTVVADSGNAVYSADVYVTRAGDRLTQLAHTDSLGHYSTRFEKGVGDYLVNVRAIGYKPLRKRITRAGTDSVIVADFTLQTQAVEVAAIVATAKRQKPARENQGVGVQQGSNEQVAQGVNGALSPDQAGDINSMAANIPGILPTPGGASALGLPADQNSVQMNGLDFAGGTVPRDAHMMTRVATSSFDPSRGGFSAAQVSVELAPGGIFSSRRAHITADAPQLQFGDAYARALGEEYRGVSLSTAADGEMVRDKWYYNVSFESKNRAADYESLLSADNALLTMSGVAPDSAHRVVSALQTVGVPTVFGVPSTRSNNEYTFLGRIDHTPWGDRSFALTSYLDVAQSGALGISPTVTPTLGGSTSNVTGMLQAMYSFYFGKEYLGDLRSGLTYRNNSGDPYLRAPAGRVNLTSASLGFGGNGMLDNENSSWLWQNVADFQLYTRANRHKVRLHAESQLDLYNQQDPADLFGTYSYQSINDLLANQPAAYSRTLQSKAVNGGMWSGVFSIGDNLRKSQHFNILYGARFEANHFIDRPDFNPAVQSAFGVRTDAAPNRVHVSPRLGFSWRKDSTNRNGMTVSNLVTRYFSSRGGVWHGGAGEFRGLMSSRLLGDAARATGLPGDILQLECVGSAVPLPQWNEYLDNPALIPQQCANGAPPVYTDAARTVHLVSRDYDAPRSWRANLGWSNNIRHIGITLDGTYSLNLGQPGTYDLNFRDTPFMTLANEGNRPVYVPASSIVAATGALSPAAARINSAFGSVAEQRSDLQSRTAQFTITLLPDFTGRYYGSIAYTLASNRAQFRGFDGGGFGDPATIETAPGNFDARHQIVTQLGYSFKKFDVTLQHRLVSGLPFTPVVDGDVNGDGIAMDRAFIADTLNGAAPGYARSCVREQLGHAAGRNSCRGPWTNYLNLRVSPSRNWINTGNRINVALNLSKSWASVPDPVLYHVRGFDEVNQRFLYDLNQRFGDTHSSRIRVMNPWRLTLDVSIDLGRSIPLQQLDRYLKPGRTQPGAKLSLDTLQARYARNVTDIYEDILEESDSLLLSKDQVTALKEAQKVYRMKVDSLWHDLAIYLDKLPDHFNSTEALKRQEDAVDEAWEMTRLESPRVKEILSPLQLQLLGGMVHMLLNAKEKVHIRMWRY